MTITYALMEKVDYNTSRVKERILDADVEQLEDLADSAPERVKILKKAKVTKLIKDGDRIIGVDYEKDGKQVSV